MLEMLEAIIAEDDEEPDDDDLMDDPEYEFDSLAQAVHSAKNGLVSGRPGDVCGQQGCTHDHGHSSHSSHSNPGFNHDAHDLHEFEKILRHELQLEGAPVDGDEIDTVTGDLDTLTGDLDTLTGDLAGLGGLGTRPEDFGQYLLGTEDASVFDSLEDFGGLGSGFGDGLGGLGGLGSVELVASPEPRPPGFIDPKTGWSDLHRAARNGDAEEVKKLLAGGWAAHINAKATDGYGASLTTPLHLAAFAAEVETMALLIEAGADVNAQTKNGWTPLHNASAQAAKVDLDKPSDLARFEAAAILLRDAGATLEPVPGKHGVGKDGLIQKVKISTAASAAMQTETGAAD